jgi:secretion/DNA translocation related TadE-like protein
VSTVRRDDDNGSASVWVLACCLLVVVVWSITVLRTEAVRARHRVESAADLAALAAAGQIGVDDGICTAARKIARANSGAVVGCVPRLAPDGRSGTVTVEVREAVRLPVVGSRTVRASARAGRMPSGHPADGATRIHSGPSPR